MLRDNSQRAKNAIYLFWIFFGVTLITIASSFMEYNLLQRASAGNLTIDEANANDLRERIVGVGTLLVHIVVIVYFIMWFRRAYYNLHSVGCYLQFSEGWAAGCWFVPFLNLVRPYQIMREIWDKTQERAQQGTQFPVIKSASILGLWWFLWIVTNIASNIYTRIVLSGDHGISELITLDKVGMIVDAFDLVNVLIIITIIRKISSFEENLKNMLEVENISNPEAVLTS